MMEPWVPAYHRLGTVPKRVGSRLPGTAPNSLYPTRDDAYILLAANNDAIFRRLAEAMGRPDLSSDPRFSDPRARAINIDALDAEIELWTKTHDARDAQAKLDGAGVPASLVYTIADIFNDEHYRARDMLLEAPHSVLGKLTVPGIVPKLSATPGGVHRLGSALGADTATVLQRVLNFSPDHIERLKADGVIATSPDVPERSRRPAKQAVDGLS
jgi:succinyl-CoA--D-citramalate CoA-transferase